jgi:hypothetical protein
MPIRDLLKDKAIVPAGLSGDERVVTEDFVLRRVRALVAATPSFADPAKPGDITKAATTTIATTLKADVPKVKTAHTSISTLVTADVTKGLHVDVTPASLLKRVSDRPPAGDGTSMRKRLVFAIVYQSCAADMTLADPANIDRLHKTCDRRLRIVERMLYDVGRHGGRGWDKKQIKANPSGPWLDGTERAFEYPRVPRTFFFDNCNPGHTDVCKPPMTGWKLGDDKTIMGPLRTNPTTTSRWVQNAKVIDILEYTHPASGSVKPIDAVRELFKPTKDFLQRNLMYCDHTIHALHIEALIFSEMKRRAATDTAWFDNLATTKGQGWLRLSYPMAASGSIPNSLGKYLVGSGEPAFFEHVRVRPQDLQVGDHLIVYNHPAYEFTTLHGAWRLENAIVVQTTPELRVQGHGSPILTLDTAKAVMLDYFLHGLDSCRTALQPLAGVVANGPTANHVTVDDVSKLRDGMHIEIADRKTEVVLADKRVIESIDARKKIVKYSGASVTASAKHVLRRKRVGQFKANYESIELEAATSPRTIFLMRRVTAAASKFAPAQQLADWHVTWLAADWEEAVRVDAKKAAFVKSQHLIEYTREDAGGGVFKTVGWLPLYEIAMVGPKPVIVGGKIASIKPLSIGARHIAAWGWFADPDVNAAVVTVVRPKVV